MPLSNELQIGKAGEHLVCCDLIQQGFNAFLADQGLPYDVVADVGGRLLRVQVKTTTKLVSYQKSANVYRYATLTGRVPTRIDEKTVDYFAFAALDIMKVAYLPVEMMISRSGGVKGTVEFKSRQAVYPGRVYANGTVRTPEWGRYFEDYSEFAKC